MRLDADIVIVGAGAAGLSLAVRLVGSGLRTIVVDAREGFSDDRTFSGFSAAGARGAPAHPFEGAISNRYPRIALFDGRGSVERNTGALPYVRISGDLFYGVALRKLGAAASEGSLLLGTRVLETTATERSVRLETSRGSISAQLVVEASGHFAAPERDPLAQVFLGRFVRTARPIFDPDRAVLMDFRLPQKRGAHFMYVLPTSRTEALVEDTYFTTGRVADAEHQADIDAWLDRAGAGEAEILRTERGVLPMSVAPAPPTGSARIVRLGISAGAAKGSTGYAFGFIQRHADALASAIRGARLAERPKTLPTWPAVRGKVASFYDAVFLRFVRSELSRRPEAIGDALVDLFRHGDTASVARFLSERAGPLDLARVMAAMPTHPFVSAAREELRGR